MVIEIPYYALRAYAVLFTRYGTKETFTQAAIAWAVRESMRKKIFSVLVKAGWLTRVARGSYRCVRPEIIIKRLLEFKVPAIMRQAIKPYAFTGLSAIEVWSDYSYVQRSIEQSPYFIQVLKKDIPYWKQFFACYHVPVYIREGSTIGEYVILMPVSTIAAVEKDGFNVLPLQEAAHIAKSNDIYAYSYNYMRRKYGLVATARA